jgi:hypothetical protein
VAGKKRDATEPSLDWGGGWGKEGNLDDCETADEDEGNAWPRFARWFLFNLNLSKASLYQRVSVARRKKAILLQRTTLLSALESFADSIND